MHASLELARLQIHLSGLACCAGCSYLMATPGYGRQTHPFKSLGQCLCICMHDLLWSPFSAAQMVRNLQVHDMFEVVSGQWGASPWHSNDAGARRQGGGGHSATGAASAILRAPHATPGTASRPVPHLRARPLWPARNGITSLSTHPHSFRTFWAPSEPSSARS